MTTYPTKKEILDALPYTNVSNFVPILSDWKVKYYTKKWSQIDLQDKFYALKELCIELDEKKKIKIAAGTAYTYTPSREVITVMPNEPSILSTLHEVGHYLYGRSELDACRFSVKLFMTCFPNEYKRLEWRGHMLKLPS